MSINMFSYMSKSRIYTYVSQTIISNLGKKKKKRKNETSAIDVRYRMTCSVLWPVVVFAVYGQSKCIVCVVNKFLKNAPYLPAYLFLIFFWLNNTILLLPLLLLRSLVDQVVLSSFACISLQAHGFRSKFLKLLHGPSRHTEPILAQGLLTLTTTTNQ